MASQLCKNMKFGGWNSTYNLLKKKQRNSVLDIDRTVFKQREDGMKLVRDAIAAGIFNDLGSGSNIDLCVITKDKVEYLRPYDEANKKGVR